MELHEYQYKPTTAAAPEPEQRVPVDSRNTRYGYLTLCVFAVCFTAICITGMLLMWG